MDFYEFIKPDNECAIHFHTTTKENAEDINRNGFYLTEANIFNTTDEIPINFKKITVDWALIVRDPYGDCVVVMHFGKNLMDKYGNRFFDVIFEIENIKQRDSEDEPWVCKVPRSFIKGFWNRKTNEITFNKHYNPSKDLKKYELKYTKLTNK